MNRSPADIDNATLDKLALQQDLARERRPQLRTVGGDDGGAPPARLIQTSAKFVEDFIPPDYLLDGIIQRRFIYSFTGKTGSGKTAIMLLVAASVALGRPIGGHDVPQGKVLYFAGENPDDIRMRWIAMAPHLDFDVETIPVSFIPGTFKISELLARIQEEAATSGPFALVIIDTSAAYFEGDDVNNNVQQGAHARRLRSLTTLPGEPCVIVGCHPVKNAAPDNLLPLGGGAFLNEMDGNLTAANGDGAVEVHWQGKFRGPDFAPLTFGLRTVTHPDLVDGRQRLIPTVLASYLSEAAKEQIAAAARADEDQLLKVLSEDPGGSLSEIARRLQWLDRNGEPYKMRVSRARNKLIGDKLITLERGKPTLTPRGTALVTGKAA
jgi:hypothetical protein